MARMLGKVGHRPIVYGVGTGRMKKCLGCPVENCGYQKPKKAWRQREKRVTQKWLDEYENREPIDCPRCESSDTPCGPDFHACYC